MMWRPVFCPLPSGVTWKFKYLDFFEVHKMLVKHLHQSVTLVNGFLQGAGRRSNVVVTELPYCKESITPDNVYVLDTGLKVWQVSPNSTWFSHY